MLYHNAPDIFVLIPAEIPIAADTLIKEARAAREASSSDDQVAAYIRAVLALLRPRGKLNA